jgi:hypothetical protein
MYSEPQRHYHNERHIAGCLKEFEQAKQPAADPVAVEIAIWLHDAVYDSRAGANEKRRADLASSWLQQAGAPTALVNSVRLLALATGAHSGISLRTPGCGHSGRRRWFCVPALQGMQPVSIQQQHDSQSHPMGLCSINPSGYLN